MKLVRILLAGLVFVGLNARAMDLPEFAITGGYRSNSTDADTNYTNAGSTSSYQLGALGLIPLTDIFKIRLGLLYTQRYGTVGAVSPTTGAQTNAQINLTYLDIPVTLDWQFSDYAGVFAGPVFAFNQSSSCSYNDGSSCSNVQSVASTLVPIEAGFIFKFMPNFGGEVYYETTSSKPAQGMKDFRALGVNLTVYFE